MDSASQLCFNAAFKFTALYSGFVAHWPYINATTLVFSTMAVYGNGDMRLDTGGPDYITSPSISHNVPSTGVVGQQYQFSATAIDPCGYGLTYWFNYGNGWTMQTTHTFNSAGVYPVQASAVSSSGLFRNSTTSVTIGNMLTVQAVVGWYPLFPNVYIDGGGSIGTAPISIPVSEGYHTVTVDDPTHDPWIPAYYDNFLGFSDQYNNYYYNGESIQINSATTLTAYYEWPYY